MNGWGNAQLKRAPPENYTLPFRAIASVGLTLEL